MTKPDYTKVRKAVEFVMGTLPDKHADRDVVMNQAMDFVSTDADKGKIGTLVLISPMHYGVQRKHSYWNITFSVLPKKDVLHLYLDQFPQEITRAQYNAVRDYVQQIFKLSAVETRDELCRFKIRPNVSSSARDTAQGSREFAHAY